MACVWPCHTFSHVKSILNIRTYRFKFSLFYVNIKEVYTYIICFR